MSRNCNCNNNCSHRVDKVIDLSKLDPIPWDDVPAIVAITECGKVVVVDKPLYELTEEDRDKLDMLITDGDGTKYLSDDGTYNEIDLSSLSAIELIYSDSGATFLLNNIQVLNTIRTNLLSGIGTIIRLKIGNVSFPLEASINENVLSLIYNQNYKLYNLSGTDINDAQVQFEFNATFTGQPYPTLNEYSLSIDENRVVYYDINGDINVKRNVVLSTDNHLTGIAPDNSQYVLAGVSHFQDSNSGRYIADIGTPHLHLTLNSVDRPNIQLENESGNYLHQVAYLSEVEAINDDLEALTNEYNSFKTTVNDSFNTVNTELNSISDRIDINSGDITQNTLDIEQLREDINNQEKFRGAFNTTAEITSLPDPVAGDFAWNYQTGTIWSYNGTTWEDTTQAIPTDAAPASDSLPLVDQGIGSAGTSNEYSRGDHRHPTDTSKANVTDLNNYLLLSGNTLTNQMTGSIYLGSQNDIYLSDSGNTYIGLDADAGGTVIVSPGANGIDLQTTLGTAKYNGVEIATVDNIPDVSGFVVNGLNTGNVQISTTDNIILGDVTNVADNISTFATNINIGANAITNAINIGNSTSDVQLSFSGLTSPNLQNGVLGTDAFQVIVRNATDRKWYYLTTQQLSQIIDAAVTPTVGRVSAEGTNAISIPNTAQLISVIWNHLTLRPNQYSIVTGNITVFDPEIIANVEPDDYIEAIYLD